MGTKKKLVLASVVSMMLVLAFLVGFLPSYDTGRTGADKAGRVDMAGLLDMILLTLYLALNSERLEDELRESRAEVRMLSGILPICCNCQKIRDEENRWTQVEEYVRHRTNAQFSHGFCPECFRALYPEDADLVNEPA